MKAEKGKIIAVWGSPASGKSTFAVKLATAIYDNFESTVIVLFTDLETPMIPVIFPNDKPEDNGSVGVPLSKTDIEKEEIIKNLVTVKSRQNFGFIGYKDGENKFTYPRFGRAKAEELLARLSELADYVIVDCVSSLESNPLASTAVELADQIIRLASPDLRSISYYLSQLPLYVDSKYQSEKQIQGLNTPNADVFMPIEEAKSHLKDLAFTLPYSRQVKEQAQKGTLYEKTTDKKFQSRITEIARKVVEYCVIKCFFSNIKRGGILLTQIAVGSLHMFSLPRGYSEGFTGWCKQIIAICFTAFMQTTLLLLGMITMQTHALLGLGVMLAANEVPRIAQQFGLDTSMRVNMMSAVHTTTTAINLGRAIAKK